MQKYIKNLNPDSDYSDTTILNVIPVYFFKVSVFMFNHKNNKCLFKNSR